MERPACWRRRAASLAVAGVLACSGALCAQALAPSGGSTPPQAHAARATKVSGGAKVHVLKTDKTYKKYDATGDGKADRIAVRGSAAQYDGYYTRLKVYVNGKKLLSTPRCATYGGAYPEVKLVRCKSGKPLLYVHYATTNGYYAGGWVYRLAAKKATRLLKTEKLVQAYAESTPDTWRCYETLKAVSGNKLKFAIGSTSTAEKVYAYRYKGGKLVKAK